MEECNRSEGSTVNFRSKNRNTSGDPHLHSSRAALTLAALGVVYCDVDESVQKLGRLPRGTAQTKQHVVHPLSKALATRVTPELEYLEAKWAAHLPYRQATNMLKEVLPLDNGISSSGIRDRILDLGKQLDAEIERDIAQLPRSVADETVRECSHVAAVSVDSAWLRNCDPGRDPGRHVNIVAGRATFTDSRSKLYSYVHKEVTSAAARLDQFLSRYGVAM